MQGISFLDLRKPRSYKAVLSQLFDLLEAEKKELKFYLKYLRDGALEEKDPIITLSQLANEYGEQTIQKAAITGLSKHRSPRSTLALAKRLLNNWESSPKSSVKLVLEV